MRDLLLVIPGHLGKDVGATAALKSDGIGSHLFSNTLGMQEERWINLQQAIGFCLAHALSDIKNDLKVLLVIPNNNDGFFYDKGLIKVHNFNKDVFTLKDRVDLANSMDADVIEFHNNSAPFTASGFETLCFSKEDDMGNLSESFMACEYINNSVQKNMNTKIRGTKPIYDNIKKEYIDREIFLLKSVKNISIITESGFMSSKTDLSNIDVDLDSYNEQMGASIWLGYRDFYLSQRRKND